MGRQLGRIFLTVGPESCNNTVGDSAKHHGTAEAIKPIVAPRLGRLTGAQFPMLHGHCKSQQLMQRLDILKSFGEIQSKLISCTKGNVPVFEAEQLLNGYRAILHNSTSQEKSRTPHLCNAVFTYIYAL